MATFTVMKELPWRFVPFFTDSLPDTKWRDEPRTRG